MSAREPGTVQLTRSVAGTAAVLLALAGAWAVATTWSARGASVVDVLALVACWAPIAVGAWCALRAGDAVRVQACALAGAVGTVALAAAGALLLEPVRDWVWLASYVGVPIVVVALVVLAAGLGLVVDRRRARG